jgi:hypothetical protein
MRQIISVRIDSNEKSSQRADDLIAAIKGSTAFRFDGFSEIPVDVRFELRDEDPIGGGLWNISAQALNVELKEPADLAASVLNGHLARQVVAMQGSKEPGCIVCLGSVRDACGSVPRLTRRGYRGRDRVETDKGRIRAFCADSWAWNIPVFFWNDLPMQWLLSHAYNMLQGGDILSHLPKGSRNAGAAAMLCAIPTIGPSTATAMLDMLGPFQQLPWPGVIQMDIQEVRSGARRIGPAKARKICEVFGCC